jgi:hypothetical protein
MGHGPGDRSRAGQEPTVNARAGVSRGGDAADRVTSGARVTAYGPARPAKSGDGELPGVGARPGKRDGKANGVPGAGRRRQYVTPGYQACTSIRLSGTSPARRASRGWSRVGTRWAYSDTRSVEPFYVGFAGLGRPGSKTFTGAGPEAERKSVKNRSASRRKSQGSGSIRSISLHWGDPAPGSLQDPCHVVARC